MNGPTIHPGTQAMSSSLLHHPNELTAKFCWLSHLHFSEICSSSLSFQPLFTEQPSSGLPLLHIAGSYLPKYKVAPLLKKQKPMKFSHWLQVKVPTSLDGLQGLTHTNSLPASYIICSICGPLNSQSCCEPLHMLVHWIFSLENFNSFSWLNSQSPPLPTGRVRISSFKSPLSPMV